MPVQQVRFKAMGTVVHVSTLGPAAGLNHARRRIEDLEAKWSRFLPDSEISVLNRALGCATPVSSDTMMLIEASLRAASATGGRFDPTVHDAMCRIGYDRTFDDIRPPSQLVAPEAVPGWAMIEVDAQLKTVRLPLGVRFDPGGIGKGLAADLVAEELVANGAPGVVANVGGDMRALGNSPRDDGWHVAVNEPQAAAGRCTVRLADGALATSTTARRRWQAGGRVVHHMIDPRTGAPSTSIWQLATALAGSAWWAEAATKPLLLDGPAALPEYVSARLAREDGHVVLAGGFEKYL